MSWMEQYAFPEVVEDLRSDPVRAEHLGIQLRREVSPGHPLHQLDLAVVARALPQDDVVVETADKAVAVVHLTWATGRLSPPWPTTTFMSTAEALDEFFVDRY